MCRRTIKCAPLLCVDISVLQVHTHGVLNCNGYGINWTVNLKKRTFPISLSNQWCKLFFFLIKIKVSSQHSKSFPSLFLYTRKNKNTRFRRQWLPKETFDYGWAPKDSETLPNLKIIKIFQPLLSDKRFSLNNLNIQFPCSRRMSLY